MKIYLVRHGAVENPKKILYGRLPGFGLSEKGKVQARETADKLKNCHIKRIYSSPLERAQQTASIIAERLNIEGAVKIDERLTEIDPGRWQGVPLEQFHAHYEQIRAENALGDPRQTASRVISLIDEIEKTGLDSVIVSHWDPIVAVVSTILDDWTFFKNGYIDTGQYFVINNDQGKWQVEKENLIGATRASHGLS